MALRFDAATIPPFTFGDSREWHDWIMGQSAHPPEISVANLIKVRDLINEARPLLRQGPLILGSPGFYYFDLPAGNRTLRQLVPLVERSAKLKRAGDIAEWFRCAALIADTPDDDLADLECLCQAYATVGMLTDAMAADRVCAVADRAYLARAFMGRLPAHSKERWLARPPLDMAMYADAYRADRCLFQAGGAEEHARSSFPSMGRWHEMKPAFYGWVYGMQDCAMEADFDARVEDRLRRITLTPPPDYQEIVARMHFYDFQLTTPLHILTGIEADSDRRLTRLAVRILDLHRAGKALPATQDQAQDMLGDPLAFLPGGDHLSMIYERLSEDRFRLTIDPLSQISNFDDAARMPRRCKAAGCTAGTDPLIGGDTMIEPKRRIRDRTFAV